MSDRIAVIAAHPDDEVLGCGGTIARRVRLGHEVIVFIVAEGATSRDPIRDPQARGAEIAALRAAAKAANKTLGVKTVEFGGLPDNRLDGMDVLDVVKVIESFIAAQKPHLVLTHFPGDLNIDHQIVSHAVATACRPVPGATVKSLLLFETPSSTEWQVDPSRGAFQPNWFEDIGETLSAKSAALRHYGAEMRHWPHARSYEAVEALARWRGASIGCDAAEAFVLARNIASGGKKSE